MRALRTTAVALVLSWFVSTPSWSGIVESVEAVVNGQTITSGELDRFIERNPNRSEVAIENLRQQRLEELVNRILLIQEAKKRGIEAEASEVKLEVDKQMKYLQNTFGGQLQEYLDKIGGTMEDIERDTTEVVTQQILYDRMKSVATRGISVTDEDVEKFKQDNPDEFATSDTVRVWHIVLNLPPDATSEQIDRKRKEALDLVIQARSGLRDFRELARSKSDYEATREVGGDLGNMRRGQLLKEYDIVFDMKPGEVTDPMLIETASGKGFHILQAGPRSSVRDYLLEKLRTDELNKLIAELRKGAKIRFRSAPRLSSLERGTEP